MNGQINNGVFSPRNLQLFIYAANNPINIIDPTGMMDEYAAKIAFGDRNDAQHRNNDKLLGTVLENAPGTSNIVAAKEAITGTDINGQILSGSDRAIAGAGIVAGPLAKWGKSLFGWAKGKVSILFKKENPLDGTTYTSKVKEQMSNEKDLDHSFPSLIDKQADAATVTKITGGDGKVRTKVELPGSINGKDGSYNWIIEPDNSINHRQFERTRKK